MKVTLDLDQLLGEGKIDQLEYEKLSQLASATTGSLAFNVLVGFGVIAVSGAALALVPTPATAIIIGLGVLAAGLFLLRGKLEQWRVLANICILVGALMAGGGIITQADGHPVSVFCVAVLLAIMAVFARSGLLAVLATLTLSAAIGARTGYLHASYFLGIEEPAITIILFTALAIGVYQLSRTIPNEFEKVAIASARTSVFLVNFGFWIGSLWGERSDVGDIVIPDVVFSLLWAATLLATAIWSWKANRRWVLNTVVVFGGIHFYTQWFEHLGATPATVLFAGLLALGFALGLRVVNTKMKEET
jgi:hypothetical protein